ncbi:MAG: hypothetical protein Q8R97_05395 [Brevundimonas sp.]|nr:hypothetical protein [Brevundimonas sp.]
MAAARSKGSIQHHAAAQILAALQIRYGPPQHALLPQVGNGTGSACSRHADAVALSLWPSRGLDLHGFEIKSYRGDWLRELKNPAKADDVASYCDFFWVVAGDDSVSQVEELPVPWGLMVLRSRGLFTVKAAQRRTDATPIDRLFLAAMLRRATEQMVPRDSITERIAAAREAGVEAGRAVATSGETEAVRELAALRQTVDAFVKASGIGELRWNGEDLGKAFRLARELGHLRAGWELKVIEKKLGDALESVKRARSSADGEAAHG